MGGLNAKMVALGTALGTALGNAALQIGRQMLDAAKAALEYADALSNLSAKTGISLQGLQRLEAMGATAGVVMETLANAVAMLQKNLDSEPAAQKALAEMGLNFERIRDLEPEDHVSRRSRNRSRRFRIRSSGRMPARRCLAKQWDDDQPGGPGRHSTA